MSLNKLKIIAGVLIFLAFIVACDEPRGYQTETRSVALEGATRAEVRLRMGAGELGVRAADQEALLEASFEFNRERLRPEVYYRRSGDKGILEVRHAHRRGISFGPTRNRWDLSLSRAVPLDLDINLGAGESRMDLGGLKIRRLEIDMGVGEMKLDLQGPHAESFRVKINGGVGSGTLYLPSDVGVRVKVDGGLGSINTRGLTKDHGDYVNDAYGQSPVSVEIDINAGIGSLDLRCEPGGRVRI